MIPTKTEDIQITSTVEGESIRMRIDEDATEHIIALLTDLYSDPQAAIIREVSTNALDSHVAAGQTRPIEVTTPTPLSPQYKVQDWGLGLNAEDFRNIYSLYGKSTKTNTNDQTGSLGLGCKSPLTYTNQFTVVGVKDGIKTSAMVSRDEDGIPTIDIVDESPTDEPHGATVTIVAQRHHELHEKAKTFFQFWPKSTVLLNGELPKTFVERAKTTLQVTDDATLCTHDREHKRSSIVMCNVAYPLKDEYVKDLNLQWTQSVVFQVKPGEVHFTPSREELNYTRKTIKTIEGLKERYLIGLLKAAEQEVESQPTKPEALAKALYWSEQLSRFIKTAFTYKGEEIPVYIPCPDQREQDQFPVGVGMVMPEKVKVDAGFVTTPGHSGHGKMSASSTVSRLHYNTHHNAIFVYGWERGMTATVKKKMWIWCQENNLKQPPAFVMTKNKIKSDWLDPKRMVHWDDIDSIKLARTGGSLPSGKIAGSYFGKVYPSQTRGLIEIMADEIDTTHPIIYADSDSYARNAYDHFEKLEVYDKFTVVVVHVNRLEKFKRLFPTAQAVGTAKSEVFETWWDSISPAVKEAMTVQYHMGGKTFMVHRSQIRDPHIKRVMRLMRVDTKREYDMLRNKFYTSPRSEQVWKDPFARYPLYETQPRHTTRATLKQHNTLYINTIYKELYQNA